MSDILDIAYEVIAPIFIIVGLGVWYKRRYHADDKALADLLFYIFVPALMLDGLAKTEFDAAHLTKTAILLTTLSLILMLISWLVARVLKLDRRIASAFMLTVVFMNAANYGLPVNEFAFGEQGHDYTLIFITVATILMNTLGVFLASWGSVSVRQAAVNVLKVPLVYATFIGIALNVSHTQLPTPADRSLTLLSEAAIPVMLVLLGFQLSSLEINGQLRPVLVASGLRLILSPILAVGLAAVLGMQGTLGNVMIVEAGMPAAVFTGVLAAKYDSDAPFTTAVILVSTLTSIVTLSILLSLL